MIKVDGGIKMAVLPATYKVDLGRLKEAVGASTVALAAEAEFKELFPDCETGAMPPFGNLYGLPVLVAQSLTDNEEIAFNAGNHTEVVKLAFADYERLVEGSSEGFCSWILKASRDARPDRPRCGLMG
jgi:Ala-tRNA(Pro) deacylase